MNNRKTMPAAIETVLAAGSTASPYRFGVNITQRLCTSACADESPVFAPVISYVGASLLSTGLYLLTFHVEGVVHYVPCGCGSCCTKAQVVSQDFTIPLASASAPSVTIAQGTAVNGIAKSACEPCSRTFVCDIPLTVTVTTTA